LIEQLSSVNSLTLKQMRNDSPVVMGGRIVDVMPTVTKTGKSMAGVQFEDLLGKIRCVAFPEAYEKWNGALVKGAMVFLLGKADTKTDRIGIQIAEVIPMANAVRRLCSRVRISMDNGSVKPESADKLREILDTHRGECPVLIELRDNGSTIRIQAGRSFMASASEEFRRAVKNAFGDQTVMTYVGHVPELPEDRRDKWRKKAAG
jgi:DNA polymerase III alpha subunit